MEFLGVGPLEIIFILLIALVVMGPKDIVKAGRTIGRFLNGLVKSDTWRMMKRTTQEIRTLPNKLMKDAGLEEDTLKEISAGLIGDERERSMLNPTLTPSRPAPASPNSTTAAPSSTPAHNAWSAPYDRFAPSPPADTPAEPPPLDSP